MEELVAIHAEPIGIADVSDARPIDIQGGRIVFDAVTFHYGGHVAPLYDALSVDIRAGERVGLVGRSGSGKTTFVKLVQRLYDVSGFFFQAEDGIRDTSVTGVQTCALPI